MRPIPGVKGIVPQMWSDFADVKAQFRRCDEMAQKPETAMVLQQVWSAALIMLATVTVTVSAQTGPDFSGRWVLATPRASADVPSALSVSQTLVRTTPTGNPMAPFFRDITIERQFENSSRSETHRIGMQGGIVPGLHHDGSPHGPTVRFTVRWEGQSLVFESGSHAGQLPEHGVWSERREVWTLDPDGHLRVVITTRSSTDGSTSVALVYRQS
jgi:hypothetical protein